MRAEYAVVLEDAMDKLENEHKPEEVPDYTSKLQRESPASNTTENLQKVADIRSWPEQGWKRLIHWLKASSSVPEWLPSPWNYPIAGYICAILIPLLSILVTLLLKHILLTFIFPATLVVIAMVVVAFFWGTGPGLLATLWGTFLFNLSVLSPQLSLSLNTFQDIFQTCFLLAIGIIMCLVVSRIERVRQEAVAAHLEIEKLVTQLESERDALRQAQQLATERASEIEAIFEAIADGVYVFNSQGHLVRTNGAAQAFNPLLRQPEYQTLPYSERFSSLQARDEQGQMFEYPNQPLTRILRGEMVTGSDKVDTLLLQQNGTNTIMNISGAPMWDAEGQIKGAVIVSRDITGLRNLELRTHEAFDALLAMTRLIGHGFEGGERVEDETHEQTRLISEEGVILGV